MRIIIVLLLINLGLTSCNNKNSLQEKIKGVWIYGEKKDIKQLDSDGIRFASIYDFKDNGELYFKKYGYGDTIYSWKLDIEADSIITIDTINYKIKSIDDQKLVLYPFRSKVTYEITYIRPDDITIDKNKEEIEKILLSDTWTTLNPNNKTWQTNFEFFDNHIMTYRYKYLDKNFKDSMNNIQIESWMVDKYKNYTFLVNYIRILSNGNYRKVNQISEIDQNSYSIIDKVQGDKIRKFITKKQTDKRKTLSEFLKGNWRSKNSKSKNYGWNQKFLIKSGEIAPYEGFLNLTVNEDKLYFQIDTFKPIEYKWKLGREGKTLLLEYRIKEPYFDGFVAKYADIEELTENKLRIRLFDNNFSTGKEKPYNYILNLIQEFERVE